MPPRPSIDENEIEEVFLKGRYVRTVLRLVQQVSDVETFAVALVVKRVSGDCWPYIKQDSLTLT